ncbi:MAG: hypothetical protein V7638_4147 [Acidobacteriota bacterium]
MPEPTAKQWLSAGASPAYYYKNPPQITQILWIEALTLWYRRATPISENKFA